MRAVRRYVGIVTVVGLVGLFLLRPEARTALQLLANAAVAIVRGVVRLGRV